MSETSKDREQQTRVRRSAALFIAVCISLIVVLAGCDSKETEKIDIGKRIKDAERQKMASKKRSDIISERAPDDPVRLSVATTVEPYVIRVKDPEARGAGFEVDIVREAFALEGIDVKFVYEPLKRTKISFMQKQVDGVMDVKKHYPEVQGAFFSVEYITYYNFAISLQSRKLVINTISGLAGKRVIGFQQARVAFGKEFQAMTEKNPGYREMANQKSQISMLFLNRVDVIVLDRRIFRYHRERLKDVPTGQPVTYHELFEPSSFRIAFRDRKMRDAFNLGFKKIKESGRYKEIIDSYAKELSSIKKGKS